MDGCSVIGLGRHVLKPAILVTQIREVPDRVRILISRPDFGPKEMKLLDLQVMLVTIWYSESMSIVFVEVGYSFNLWPDMTLFIRFLF